MGLDWSLQSWTVVSWIAAAGFGLTAASIILLIARPSIEIHETHLQIGRREISWNEIQRLDQTGWTAPLAVQIILEAGERLLLIYPGDLDSSTSLLRHLRRYSRQALIEGIPYRQFWGEAPTTALKQLPPPRYPVLRPEDEEEVERMFQRLKAAGRIDEHAPDEKIGEK